MGIACHSEIREWNEYARKTISMQIYQRDIKLHKTPLLYAMEDILSSRRRWKRKKNRRNTNPHGEDAGKSIHDQDPLIRLLI